MYSTLERSKRMKKACTYKQAFTVINYFIIKNIEGRNGPKGLIKGVGQGLLGVFVKPMGSLFDGLSLSLDGLKRFAMSGSEQIVNGRLPCH